MLFNPSRFGRTFFCGLFLILLAFLPVISSAETEAEIKAKEDALRAKLLVVDAEIVAQKKLVQTKQKETASIKRDVDILTSKINTAQLNIQSKKIQIDRLSGNIVEKVKTINVLNDKLDTQKQTLAELLRQTREVDSRSFLEVVLANEKMSDLFVDLGRFQFIEQSTQDSLNEFRSTKNLTEQQKADLQKKQDAELDAKKAIETEKARTERLNKEQKVYLAVSKNQEAAYKEILAKKVKEQQAIRSALFSLRNAANITFGQAYDYAKTVQATLGVRPAFLLAIITQESNLGKNVGTCNRPQDSKKWQDILPGPDARQMYLSLGKSCARATTHCSSRDDQTPFLEIMKSLGRDPEGTPLSCPILSAGPFGGAMGPAQFIPSTWNMLKDRIGSALGKSTPDPWLPADAFMASGIYLDDLGAGSGNYSAEIRAACKYYGSGGSSCSYGNQVMSLAATYDKQIDILQNN
ncbi:MAG: lytic murein transglycosylase [Candidatus Vogelbacteria bacterium]|nr:lytic murein transglycosylase [Candidatus Vogelbacteria bacterium]